MPRLEKEQNTKRIDLLGYPKDDPGWVDLYIDPPIGAVLDANDFEKDSDKGAMTVVSVIAEWNLTEEDGKVAKISLENVRKLGLVNFPLILKEVNKLMPSNKEIENAGKKKDSGLDSES